MFDNNFNKILEKADYIYGCHKKKKGNLWRELPIDSHADGIREEYEEWYEEYRKTLKALRNNDKTQAREFEENQYYELIDLMNRCMMYAEVIRLRMEKRRDENS